jgi:hypothetical protein
MITIKDIERISTFDDWFDDFKKKVSYARYEFSGTIKDELIEMLGRMPTPEEIIRLVDGDLCNFGASCRISGRHFSGYVYTD